MPRISAYDSNDARSSDVKRTLTDARRPVSRVSALVRRPRDAHAPGWALAHVKWATYPG